MDRTAPSWQRQSRFVPTICATRAAEVAGVTVRMHGIALCHHETHCIPTYKPPPSRAPASAIASVARTAQKPEAEDDASSGCSDHCGGSRSVSTRTRSAAVHYCRRLDTGTTKVTHALLTMWPMTQLKLQPRAKALYPWQHPATGKVGKKQQLCFHAQRRPWRSLSNTRAA